MMSKTRQPRSGGFGLVEVLVYVALLVLIATTAVSLLLSLQDQVEQQRAHRLLTKTATVALERMVRDIRQSTAVDTAASVTPGNPGTLVLDQDGRSVEFSRSGSSVVVREGGGAAAAITDPAVSVFGLRFYPYDNGRTELVRITLLASTTVGDTTITEQYQAAAVLRGSYE